MNTLRLEQENIQNYRFKERMNFTGAGLSRRTERDKSSDSVRQKNGFYDYNMSAPDLIKSNYGSAKKSEYTRDKKSPSKNVSFGGLSGNKFFRSVWVRGSLEWAHNNGALASAFAALFATCILRPATIMTSPNVEMENRKIASAKSISSGLIGYAFTLVVSSPISEAWKKFEKRAADVLTDTEYERYTGKSKVKPEDLAGVAEEGADLIKLAKENSLKELKNAKSFGLAGRFFKMSADFLCSIPKAMLTIALIPPLLNVFFSGRRKNASENLQNPINNNSTDLIHLYSKSELPNTDAVDQYANQKHYIYFRQNEATANSIAKAKARQQAKTQSPAFKGASPKAAMNIFQKAYDKLTDVISVIIEKIVKTDACAKISKKCQDAGIESIIQAFTGVVLAAFYIRNTQKSPKIDEYRKKPLMYNDIITTILATVGALWADKKLDKPLNRIEEKFQKANGLTPDHVDFAKFKSGFKIMKSAVVFGTMYRWVLPWISTIAAEKVWKLKKEDTKNHAAQPSQPVVSAPKMTLLASQPLK